MKDGFAECQFSELICENNKQKYFDYEDSDSEYSINLGSDDGSEDSSEIQLSGSEDSNDDGTIENARSWTKINTYNPHAPPRFQFSGDPKILGNIR
ncbi:uncharacterized protein TNCV_2451381 [Trichonephila clavipes]|nr:uncharacterized protein TNCV_2451381 [Trichonephila clavipes]